MFLSRVELGPRAADKESFWREATNPYGAHQALWKLLSRSPEQKRDFLFRSEEGNAGVSFLVLSQQPPSDANGMWRVESRTFAPALRSGQHLGFRLRASAVVSRKGSRHDVVMDRKSALKKAGSERPEHAGLVQEAGIAWLQAQASKSGFRLAESAIAEIGEDGLMEDEGPRPAVRVDGYRQHRIRSGPRRSEPIRFSTLDYEGTLEVIDPEVFLDRVRLGFGPQKAFGCGLMLLRRG